METCAYTFVRKTIELYGSITTMLVESTFSFIAAATQYEGVIAVTTRLGFIVLRRPLGKLLVCHQMVQRGGIG